MFTKPEAEEFVLTVGGGTRDAHGYDSQIIQSAVDAVSQRGGGTVQLGEGVFSVAAPIRLNSNVTLRGMGEKTTLHKVDGFRSAFVEDADYGEYTALVADASGFAVGMGIELYDAVNKTAWDVTTAVITKIDGNRIHFDRNLLRDYSADQSGLISNACSMIEAVDVRNCRICDLVLEGNAQSNDYIGGCRGGAIYLHKAADCTVENVVVRDYNGDGISWQITDGVQVRGCEVSGCRNFGLHPGTGSGGSIVENCNLHHNGTDGLFVCWRVQHGFFRDNVISENGRHGISIGHKDSFNRFERNIIRANSGCGVFFREEKPSNAANGNIFTENVLLDNGLPGEGVGILVKSPVEGLEIVGNTISDTGSSHQIDGIQVNGREDACRIEENKISVPGRDIVFE